MSLTKLHLLVSLGISGTLLACGPDCTSMCEQAQEDGDCFREADGDDQDCEALCEDVEEIAAEDNGDCEDELDELVSCMNDEENACDSLEESCTDEFDDFRDCIGDYCIDHPSNDTCADLILE